MKQITRYSFLLVALYSHQAAFSMQETQITLSPNQQLQEVWSAQEKQEQEYTEQRAHAVSILLPTPTYLNKMVSALYAHQVISGDIMEILIAVMQAAQCHVVFAKDRKLSKSEIAYFKDTIDKLVKVEINLKNEKICAALSAGNSPLFDTLTMGLPETQESLQRLFKTATHDPRTTWAKIKDFFPEKYKECKSLTKEDVKFWNWPSGRAKKVCESFLVANLFLVIGRSVVMSKNIHNEAGFYVFTGLTMADYLAMSSIVIAQYLRQTNRYPNSFVRLYGIALLTYWVQAGYSIPLFYGK